MIPVVRYMLLCDDVRIDPDKPMCTQVACLMSRIASLESPPYPLVREVVCVYLVLADCHGKGVRQIRFAYVDGEHERPLFGSKEHLLDFSGHSPLELLGVVFRIEAGQF